MTHAISIIILLFQSVVVCKRILQSRTF